MKVDLKPIILNQSSMENVAQKIDFSKATKDLEWIPNTSFKEGILKTVKWYKNYYQI
jgi:nucleoside-diphosphate-sugar epimerase